MLAEFCACPIAGFARFQHRMRQQLDAEVVQHQNVFAAMSAEVLVRCASAVQRIYNEFAHFLAEKWHIGGARRTVCFGAQHSADLHWSRRRRLIFEAEYIRIIIKEFV